MTHVELEMPDKIYQALQSHLLPVDSGSEQAAFVFARAAATPNGGTAFQFVDWFPLVTSSFAAQGEHYLELRDEASASVIKRAHDLGASLVEFHSHPSPFPAEFSPSDLAGFMEFVPHVWWRLRFKPYAAVVMAPSSLDGLAWLSSPHAPILLNAISTENRKIHSTGLTLRPKTTRGLLHGKI